MAYQGRPGRFTVASVEDQGEKTISEPMEEDNNPRTTALIVRHQTDYPYGNRHLLCQHGVSS